MNRRSLILPLALLVLVATGSQPLRAEDAPSGAPIYGASLIRNNSQHTWQVKCSDKVSMTGVVNFYAMDDKAQAHSLGTITNPFTSNKVQIPPGDTLMVVSGSEVLPMAVKNIGVIATHLTLSICKDCSGYDKTKDDPGSSILHVVHVQYQDMCIDSSKLSVVKSLGTAYTGFDWHAYCPDQAVTVEGTTASDLLHVKVDLGKYQKADAGPLWEIEKDLDEAEPASN